MKAIIPLAEHESNNKLIVEEFRKASKACIYDATKKTIEILDMDQLVRETGMLSIELKTRGIQAIISPKMSFLSLNLFLESHFQVLRARGANLKENIDLFEENRLEQYAYFSDTISAGCSESSCGSCSSCN